LLTRHSLRRPPAKKRERRSRALTAEERAERRRQRKQEQSMFRRAEMNDTIGALRTTIQTAETNQGDILDLAVQRIKDYKQRILSLQEELATRSSGKRLISMEGAQNAKFFGFELPNKPTMRAAAASGERAVKRSAVVAPSSGLSMPFSAVFHESTVALVIGDFTGRIVDANRQFQQMLGWPLEELRGRRMLQFSHPEDTQSSCASINAQVQGTSGPTVLTRRTLCRNGTYMDVNAICWVVRDADNKPVYWASVMYPRDSMEPTHALASVAAISASVGGDSSEGPERPAVGVPASPSGLSCPVPEVGLCKVEPSPDAFRDAYV
jgi:PAS domain S-box-containing protein